MLEFRALLAPCGFVIFGLVLACPVAAFLAMNSRNCCGVSFICCPLAVAEFGFDPFSTWGTGPAHPEETLSSNTKLAPAAIELLTRLSSRSIRGSPPVNSVVW